jgi:hypothetical protein
VTASSVVVVTGSVVSIVRSRSASRHVARSGIESVGFAPPESVAPDAVIPVPDATSVIVFPPAPGESAVRSTCVPVAHALTSEPVSGSATSAAARFVATCASV